MARVRVTHQNITSEDASKKPKRVLVPAGQYAAMIMSANQGATKGNPPLAKVAVEFQIKYGLGEDGTEHDETHQGRRVYQDFVLEDDPTMADMSAQRRWELRMLLDACDVKFDDEGFDTDELLEKHVIITVRHRKGREQDDDGNPIFFTNVTKVDSEEAIDGDTLI